MIGKRERNRIKKILGKCYSAKVKTVLEADDILDSTGKTPTENLIRTVFNGQQNAVIETYIYKAVEIQIESDKIEKARRQNLLKTA